MFLSEVQFTARWFGLALLATAGLPATAQQTIQFSKPVGTDPAKVANAFIPETKHLDPASFNAPPSLFGSRPTASFDVLPGSPPPILYNASAQQWQKFLDDKKNWTLMTPEEILGVPTPEKILGVTDPNDDPTISPVERFLKRQDQEEAIAATNGVHRMDWLLGHKDDSTAMLFHGVDSASPFAKAVDGSPADKTEKLHELTSIFGSKPDSSPGLNARADSAWASPFDCPQPLPKPTPEQLAGMERFRALMDPPAEDKPSPAAGLFGASVAAPDPNIQALPVSFNPAGRSAMPLQRDIALPTGLTPLPGVTGPLPPPKKPAPLVQPPPWMQSPLQNPTMPQRQF